MDIVSSAGDAGISHIERVNSGKEINPAGESRRFRIPKEEYRGPAVVCRGPVWIWQAPSRSLYRPGAFFLTFFVFCGSFSGGLKLDKIKNTGGSPWNLSKQFCPGYLRLVERFYKTKQMIWIAGQQRFLLFFPFCLFIKHIKQGAPCGLAILFSWLLKSSDFMSSSDWS